MNNQFKPFILIILLLAQICLSANNYSIQKWQIADLNFSTKKSVANPLDVELGAIFRHENGKTMRVPGFWNGNNDWVIRISPSLEGKWTYTTWSSVTALSGLTGQLTVLPNQKSDRHGPVRIAKNNQQRFEYEDGTVYFPLAYEIDWLFALDAENKTDVPRTRQIVKVMAENHFNKAIMNVYAYDAGWGERDKIDPKFNFAKPGVFPFGGTNESPDHSTLNIEFFKHFDRVMNVLHDHEIVSHLMIYVWNKKVNWPKPGSEADNRYFDYVVKRYQAYPNLLWDISKEALAYGMDDMNYIVGRIDRLKKLDGHHRLVTVHDYSFCEAYPDLVDFISVQEWRPNLYNEMLNASKKHSGKPIFNVEHGGYEKTMHNIFHGAYVDPVICLERNYQCIFAGVYSTYYWQNTSWYELVYDPYSLPKEKQPKFGYYKIMMEFLKKFNFNQLTPGQYFYSTYCLTDNKSVYLYLATPGIYALEGSTPKTLQNKKVEIQWFNPLTGQYSEKEVRTVGEWTGFRKPASIDSPFSVVIIQPVN